MAGEALTDLVSVVVCAKNRASLIGDALRSIELNHPREIIVIDDSTDTTAAVARQFADKVVSGQGNGLAAARQLGAELATGRYVAYVDSDVVLTEGCLAALVQVLETDAGVAAATATLESRSTPSYWARGKDFRRLSRHTAPGDVRLVGCGATVFRRDVLIQHPFNSVFSGAGEDTELSVRLRQAGWRLCRSPAVAYHRDPATFLGLVRQRIWYGRGMARRVLAGQRGYVLPFQSRGRPGAPSIRRLVMQGKISLIPFHVVSGTAYYLGELIEVLAAGRDALIDRLRGRRR